MCNARIFKILNRFTPYEQKTIYYYPRVYNLCTKREYARTYCKHIPSQPAACVVVRKNKSFRELPRADLIFSRPRPIGTTPEPRLNRRLLMSAHCSRRRYRVRRTATNPSLIFRNRRTIVHPYIRHTHTHSRTFGKSQEYQYVYTCIMFTYVCVRARAQNTRSPSPDSIGWKIDFSPPTPPVGLSCTLALYTNTLVTSGRRGVRRHYLCTLLYTVRIARPPAVWVCLHVSRYTYIYVRRVYDGVCAV